MQAARTTTMTVAQEDAAIRDVERGVATRGFMRLAQKYGYTITKDGTEWMPDPSSGISVVCTGVHLELSEWIHFRRNLHARFAGVVAVFLQAFDVHAPGVARAIARAWVNKHLMCAHQMRQCCLCGGFKCKKCDFPVFNRVDGHPCECKESVWCITRLVWSQI